MSMDNKNNKSAIITGGSKGIGKSIALAFSKLGYHITILDLLDTEGAITVKEIEKNHVKAKFIKVDICSEEGVRKSVEQSVELFGNPSVLVNNAGIFPRKKATEISMDEWNKVLNVNLRGTFLCSKEAAPYMINQGKGVILNIASRSGVDGEIRGAHYSASKAGVIGLTKSLALEWAPEIRVNSIIPGLTDTDQPREDMNDDQLYKRGNSTPLGRIGKSEDIANAACLLISPEASYITGQSLCVNGGAIMR